jgi:hypothetical protein
MSEVDRYLSVNPTFPWDKNKWSEYDAAVDTRFHQTDIFFSPLINNVQMPKGVGLNQYYFTGRELIQAHHNANAIGWYDHFIDSFYVDTREKSLQSRYRYAVKSQYDEFDELVTRFGIDPSNPGSGDEPGFIKAVMQEQLLDGVRSITERIARNAHLQYIPNLFMGDGTAFSATTWDFSDMDLTDTFKFDIKFLEEMSLRMSFRCEDTLHKWGNYAQPVPGDQFRNNVLVMVPTSVMYDIWNSEALEWLINLRQLTDERIINGGEVQYRKITISDYGHGMIMWNVGNITRQVVVTSPIKWGDGAPDPATAKVDNVWVTGQGSADITHYVQCAAGSTMSDFVKGDIVTLHTKRTSSWGVTNGVDPTDGETFEFEVYSVDDANDRITFRKPITYAYDKLLPEGGGYAYITKAQNVYPVYCIGSRGAIANAQRTPWRFYRPTDTHRDFPSTVRVSADWRCEHQLWNPDLVEIVFCSGSFGNRGNVTVR